MATNPPNNMTPSASVILCTHNPRTDFLSRALASLRSQTLPFDQWEFILIDNASDRALSSSLDLSWHPQTKLIREDHLGLTHARIRGLAESRADLLVFVDDDNILDNDYLERALEIGRDWQILGAWGGQCIAE